MAGKPCRRNIEGWGRRSLYCGLGCPLIYSDSPRFIILILYGVAVWDWWTVNPAAYIGLVENVDRIKRKMRHWRLNRNALFGCNPTFQAF